MSDTPKGPAVPPPVHVDTPEQAAARQLVETNARVTHVVITPEGAMPPPEEKDFSLTAALPKKPADVKPPVVSSAATHGGRSKEGA